MEKEDKTYCKQLRFYDDRYPTDKVILGIIIFEDKDKLIFKTGKGREYGLFKSKDEYIITNTDILFMDESVAPDSNENNDWANNSDNTDNEDDYSNYDDEVQL